MHTQIGKWGNSLAVRIPGIYAKDLHLKEGMDLDVVPVGRRTSLEASTATTDA